MRRLHICRIFCWACASSFALMLGVGCQSAGERLACYRGATDESAVHAIEPFLQKRDSCSKREAIEVLGTMQTIPAARQRLLLASAANDAVVRAAAGKVMMFSQYPELHEEAIRLVKDPDPDVRHKIVRILHDSATVQKTETFHRRGAVGGKVICERTTSLYPDTNRVAQAVEMLVCLAEDTSPRIRSNAGQCLAALGTPESIATAIQLLQSDKEPEVRCDMAKALGDVLAVDAFNQEYETDNSGQPAVLGLDGLPGGVVCISQGGDRIVDALLASFLKDDGLLVLNISQPMVPLLPMRRRSKVSIPVRFFASEALLVCAPPYRPKVEHALRAATHDPRKAVREDAQELLNSMAPAKTQPFSTSQPPINSKATP